MSYTWDGQQGPFAEAAAADDDEVIAGWMHLYDPGTNKPYYWHTVTGVVQWELPPDFAPGAHSPIVKAALALQRAFRKPRFGSPMAIKRITAALKKKEAEDAAAAAAAAAEEAAKPSAAGGAPASDGDGAAGGSSVASPAGDASPTSDGEKGKKRRKSLFGQIGRKKSGLKVDLDSSPRARRMSSVSGSMTPGTPKTPSAHRISGSLSFQVDMTSDKDKDLAELKVLGMMTKRGSAVGTNLLAQKMKQNAKVKADMLKKSAAAKKLAVEEAMRREQLDRNFANAAWVEPSAGIAVADMNDSVFENGKAPCCTTRLSELGRLGVGVRLYFEVVRMLSIVFLIMGIISLPTIVIGFLGDRTDNDPQMAESILAGTTLANLNIFTLQGKMESHQYLVPDPKVEGGRPWIWADYATISAAAWANVTQYPELHPAVDCNTFNPGTNATQACRQYICINYPRLPEWTTYLSYTGSPVAFAGAAQPELRSAKAYNDWTERQNDDTTRWAQHCNLDARWMLLIITLCDTISTVFYLVMMFRFVSIAATITANVDDQNVTAIDYAIHVRGLPWDIKKQQLATHFSNLYDLEHWSDKLEMEAQLRKAKRKGAAAAAREKAQQRRRLRARAKVVPVDGDGGDEGDDVEAFEDVEGEEHDLEAAEGDDYFPDGGEHGEGEWHDPNAEYHEHDAGWYDEGGEWHDHDAGWHDPNAGWHDPNAHGGAWGGHQASGESEEWDEEEESEGESDSDPEVRENVVTAMLASSAIELKPVKNNLMVSPVTEVDGHINYKGGWVAEVALVHPHGNAISQFETFMETLEDIRTARATIQKYSDGSPWRHEVLDIWEVDAHVRVRQNPHSPHLHGLEYRKGIIIECTEEDEDMMLAKVRLRDGIVIECSPHDDLEVFCLPGVTGARQVDAHLKPDRWMTKVERWCNQARVRVRDDAKTFELRNLSGAKGVIVAVHDVHAVGKEGTASLLLDDGTLIETVTPYVDLDVHVLPHSKPPKTPHHVTQWVWCACAPPCRYATHAFPDQGDAFTHVNNFLFGGAIEEYEYFPIGVWCCPPLKCHTHRLRQSCCCGKYEGGAKKRNPACPEAPPEYNCCAKMALCWMSMWTCCCFPEVVLGSDNDALLEAENELADLEVHTKKLKELKVKLDPLAFEAGPFRMFFRECCKWSCRQALCKRSEALQTRCERCAKPDLFDTVNKETRTNTSVTDVSIAAYIVFNHDESYSLALKDYSQSTNSLGKAFDATVEKFKIRETVNSIECGGCAPEGLYTRACDLECGGGVTMERTCNKYFGCQMQELRVHHKGASYRLEVQRAPEPGAILYENVEVSSTSRFLRQVGTYTVTALLLIAVMLVVSIIENRAGVYTAGQPGACAAPRETYFDMPNAEINRQTTLQPENMTAWYLLRERERDATCAKGGKAVVYQGFDDSFRALTLEKYANHTCYGDDETLRAEGVLSLRECLSECVDPANVGLCPAYDCLAMSAEETPCGDEYKREFCQYTRKTLAACYCQRSLVQSGVNDISVASILGRIMNLDFVMCGGVARDWVLNKILETALLAVLLSIINMLLETVLEKLSVFERHAVYSNKVRALAFKLFVSQFISTAMIVELANFDSDYSPYHVLGQWLTSVGMDPNDPFIGKGSIKGRPVEWYGAVGQSMLLLMLTNIVTSGFDYLEIRLWVFRRLKFALCWTNVSTQEEMNTLMETDNFALEARYAGLLNTIFVAMYFSAGMPILYFFTALCCVCMLFLDKAFVLNFYTMDRLDGLDGGLARFAVTLLPIAALLHLVVAYQMFGDDNTMYDARAKGGDESIAHATPDRLSTYGLLMDLFDLEIFSDRAFDSVRSFVAPLKEPLIPIKNLVIEYYTASEEFERELGFADEEYALMPKMFRINVFTVVVVFLGLLVVLFCVTITPLLRALATLVWRYTCCLLHPCITCEGKGTGVAVEAPEYTGPFYMRMTKAAAEMKLKEAMTLREDGFRSVAKIPHKDKMATTVAGLNKLARDLGRVLEPVGDDPTSDDLMMFWLWEADTRDRYNNQLWRKGAKKYTWQVVRDTGGYSYDIHNSAAYMRAMRWIKDELERLNETHDEEDRNILTSSEWCGTVLPTRCPGFGRADGILPALPIAASKLMIVIALDMIPPLNGLGTLMYGQRLAKRGDLDDRKQYFFFGMFVFIGKFIPIFGVVPILLNFVCVVSYIFILTRPKAEWQWEQFDDEEPCPCIPLLRDVMSSEWQTFRRTENTLLDGAYKQWLDALVAAAANREMLQTKLEDAERMLGVYNERLARDNEAADIRSGLGSAQALKHDKLTMELKRCEGTLDLLRYANDEDMKQENDDKKAAAEARASELRELIAERNKEDARVTLKDTDELAVAAKKAHAEQEAVCLDLDEVEQRLSTFVLDKKVGHDFSVNFKTSEEGSHHTLAFTCIEMEDVDGTLMPVFETDVETGKRDQKTVRIRRQQPLYDEFVTEDRMECCMPKSKREAKLGIKAAKIPPGTKLKKVVLDGGRDDMKLYESALEEKEAGARRPSLRQAIPGMNSKSFWKKAQKERAKIEKEKAEEAAERAAAGVAGGEDSDVAALAADVADDDAAADVADGGKKPSFSFLPSALPPNWKKTVNGSGQTLYFNEKTKETSYAPPLS